jgi:hypothetical protein
MSHGCQTPPFITRKKEEEEHGGGDEEEDIIALEGYCEITISLNIYDINLKGSKTQLERCYGQHMMLQG